MSRSQCHHQFMAFDTPIDKHSTLPLTLDGVLDDWSLVDQSLDSTDYRLRPRRSGKSPCLPAPPPSTRKSSFEFFDNTSHEKSRGKSFSSDSSAPGMVEDHSGLSDSDADHSVDHDLYEESMGRVWDTYETLLVSNEPSETFIFHREYVPGFSSDSDSLLPPCLSKTMLPQKASRTQLCRNSRHSREEQAIQCSYDPIPTHNQPRVKVSSRPRRETREGHSVNIQDPLLGNELTHLHRSHAQRTVRHAPDILKTLPAIPTKKFGCSLQPSRPTQSSQKNHSHSDARKQHTANQDQPYRTHPVTNPCNSSHPYSINNTPPLSVVEKSVFDYDTDDENHTGSITQLPTSIASKMHIRGLSLGSKLGLNAKKDGSRYEGTGRRRSATEIVMGVFGLGRK